MQSMSAEDFHQDLAYVRSSLRRAEPPPTPRSITIFWAMAMLIGLPLGDFRPEWMPIYWITVGPGGWIVSGVLAIRHGRRHGQLDANSGWRQAAHWGTMVLIMFMLSALPARGLMPWEAMGPVILLLLAMTYATAAVHWGMLQLVPATLFAIGYGTMLFSPPYPWTIVGVLIAMGLFFTAFLTHDGFPSGAVSARKQAGIHVGD